MRLTLLSPTGLNGDQKKLYDRNLKDIEKGFSVFKTQDVQGRLLGPWSVFLHEPAVGEAHYDLLSTLSALTRLEPGAKQIAILTVGAHFKAAYELYAHVAVAEHGGMPQSRLAALAAGLRPDDLSPQEGAAYEVTQGLLSGGVLPGVTYRNARDILGQGALNELVFWIGQYAYVSLMLNAFDVPSEESFEAGAA